MSHAKQFKARYDAARDELIAQQDMVVQHVQQDEAGKVIVKWPSFRDDACAQWMDNPGAARTPNMTVRSKAAAMALVACAEADGYRAEVQGNPNGYIVVLSMPD